jgi:hypothetical protein
MKALIKFFGEEESVQCEDILANILRFSQNVKVSEEAYEVQNS